MTTVPQRHVETALSAVICAMLIIWLTSLVVARAQWAEADLSDMLVAASRPVASGAVAGWADTNVYLVRLNGSTNSAGTALDLSGNNNTGKLTVCTFSPITNTLNETGNAFVFNGTSQYILLTSNSVNGSADFTYSTWRNEPAARFTDGRIFICASGTSGGTHLLEAVARGDGVATNALRGYEGSYTYVATTNDTSTDAWHLIVYTRISGVASMYIDGMLIKTQALPNVTNLDTASLGARYFSGGPGSYWKGSLYMPAMLKYGVSSNEQYNWYLNYKPK